MRLIKDLFKKTILIIILISVLIMYIATPASYAKLELEEGEFYYAGTTEGSYVPSFNIFSWLLNNIGDIADWLLGIITMGFRMVFVGWTALLEKLLTWALESTTGVAADGSLVESSTDLTGLTDSSNNVTVEAIVYNKVAGLNIDFFDLEFDRAISGTGKRLVCEKCEKYVAKAEDETEEGCISTTVAASIQANAETIREEIKNGTHKFDQHCTCGCNGCDGCEKYVRQLVAEKPMIIRIRELVATWYSIIRFLAMAAMLVVLIAVGIKMALSTIASDKAVYKRMLVDWVVGVIILFAIHYFMIFCIHMNGVMVKVIEDSAQSINKVQMQQLSDGETEISNAELEIKVYEEVRTRAYDARLINGLMGMIMYMTLVFFAFKYTLIYLKRYLTILVLTLMGPAVGVAYALQKALSGKSQALKTWMTEYIMNVIIQIVHALIYAIFISQAMVLSLQSVAGMIVALILMNYTSKSEEMFKKVFKFGGGDSLLGHTENAMDSTLQGLQTAKGLVTGAKPVAKALTNTPYGKAVKGVGKAALAAGVGVARLARNAGPSEEAKYERAVDREMDKHGEGSAFKTNADGSDAETQEQYEARRADAAAVVNAKMNKKQLRKNPNRDLDNALREEGGANLRKDLEVATDALKNLPANATDEEKKAAQQQHLEALEKYNRFQQMNIPTTGDIAKGRVKRIIDLENVFENTAARDPLRLTFGTTRFNPKTFRFENDGNGIYKQFTATNLFGLTDNDKKYMKAIAGDMGKALLGMGGLFVGMASIVAQPKTGMALMAAGYAGTSKVFKKDPKLAGQSGRYTFSRFGSHSLDTIRNSAVVRAKQEHAAMVAGNIATKYPELAERLKDGTASAITIGELGGELGPLFATQNSPYSRTATMDMVNEHGGRRKTRFMKNTALGGRMDEFARHYAKQQRKQIAQFHAEGIEMQKTAIEARLEYKKEMHEMGEDEDKELEKILEQDGYALDANGNLIEVDKSEQEDDIYKVILLAAEKELAEARKAGEPVDEDTTMKKYDIVKDDVVDTIGTKTITQADVKIVNKTIDEILLKVSEGKEVDLSSEQAQDEVINLISTELAKTGLLTGGQSADVLFKKGREGLKSELKKKARKRNTAVQAATKRLEKFFTPEGATAISNVIAQVTEDSVHKGKSAGEVSVRDVVSRIEKTKDGSLHVKTADGSVKVSTRDGSSRVTGGDGSSRVAKRDGASQVGERPKLSQEQVQALEQFMQVTRAVTPVTGKKVESTKAEEKIAKAKAKVAEDKSKREKKLQQAMLALVGEEQAVSEVQTGQSKPSTQDILAQLSARDQEYVTSTVRDLLELKELNKESDRLNIDKVNREKKYLKSKTAESTSRINIATYEKQKIIEDSKTGITEAEKKSTIEAIEAKIKAERQNLSKAESQTPIIGPVIDIGSYVRNGFDEGIRNKSKPAMNNDGSKRVENPGAKPASRKKKRK